MCCNVCGKPVKIVPAFMVEGTTLTLSALAFIAFAYESSTLTWRDLPDKFCDQENKIAHSTLYKAVHSMGKLFMECVEVQKLFERYLSFPCVAVGNCHPEASGWPSSKSEHPHTIAREDGARTLLTQLLSTISSNTAFINSYLRYLERLNLLLIELNRPLPKLYIRNTGKYVNTS
jgi:hypothetical protein